MPHRSTKIEIRFTKKIVVLIMVISSLTSLIGQFLNLLTLESPKAGNLTSYNPIPNIEIKIVQPAISHILSPS